MGWRPSHNSLFSSILTEVPASPTLGLLLPPLRVGSTRQQVNPTHLAQTESTATVESPALMVLEAADVCARTVWTCVTNVKHLFGNAHLVLVVAFNAVMPRPDTYTLIK